MKAVEEMQIKKTEGLPRELQTTTTRSIARTSPRRRKSVISSWQYGDIVGLQINGVNSVVRDVETAILG